MQGDTGGCNHWYRLFRCRKETVTNDTKQLQSGGFHTGFMFC